MLWLLLLVSVGLWGQTQGTPSQIKGTGAPAGASCTANNIGQEYFRTDATAGQNIYRCTSAGTWTLFAGGSGGSTYASVEASAPDAHIGNNTWQDVNSMSVTITIGSSGAAFCTFYAIFDAQDASAWDFVLFRMVVDSTTQTQVLFRQTYEGNIGGNPIYTANSHNVFTGLSAGAHTIKLQVNETGSGEDNTITERRLTCIAL